MKYERNVIIRGLEFKVGFDHQPKQTDPPIAESNNIQQVIYKNVDVYQFLKDSDPTWLVNIELVINRQIKTDESK